jgi:hypothetical protein
MHMNSAYEDYLFSRGYFVADDADAADERALSAAQSHALEALLALAHFASIRITTRPELASINMLKVAARNIGEHVPTPFYEGFPQTARKLSTNELLFDQLLHYSRTYGLGDFSEAGHSLFEHGFQRLAFAEKTDPKPFAIVTVHEALAILRRDVEGFLASTRPLNDANYRLLERYLRECGWPRRTCACKDTACRLLLDLRDPSVADLLTLPDVIRLTEWLLEYRYPSMRINKLNLRNCDRKLLTRVLDRLFERGSCNADVCLEKRRTWKGLLHHVHYHPTCDEGRSFCEAIRGSRKRSSYSEFERLVNAGDVLGAARLLCSAKGPAAVERNLCYLLSRCTSQDEVKAIVATVGTSNKFVLAQLIMHFNTSARESERIFRFVHLGRMRTHTETRRELQHRKSMLGDSVATYALSHMSAALAKSCHGMLGKVYADPSMRNVALPLQESASQGGFNTLPRGTRLPLSRGKKLRAFIYWERVNDIDLSCFGLDEKRNAIEFSWRTMASAQSEAITYSGDQTSGYHGGSEYFDIDLARFYNTYPEVQHIVICANVYTYGTAFSGCTCRAGYMLRDLDDSGEVFEPKTVESAFLVNCASSAAFLFAIDLKKREFVWLNIAEQSTRRVAGEGSLAFLMRYMRVTEALNLHDLACMLATEVVDDPHEADVVFSDADLALLDTQEQIRSTSIARILELLAS